MTQLADNNVAAVEGAPVQTDGNATDYTDPSNLYPTEKGSDPSEESEVSGEENTLQQEQDDVDSNSEVTEVEAETPIDPPVSWNKEAKERFSQLPPDMQVFVSEQEAHRNRQVTEVTTRAAEAQREAQAQVAAQQAETQQYFAQQLEAVANAYLPPEPNPAHFQDMQSYGLAKEQWGQNVAQHQQLMQHAQGLRQQAEQVATQMQQQELVKDARRVMADLPELQDTTQYQTLVQELTPIAKELGYDDERIAQAWPSDVLAMKRVAAYKSKAEKWDKLQAQKMASVRQAKAMPKVMQPGAGGGQQQPKDALELLYPNDVRKS